MTATSSPSTKAPRRLEAIAVVGSSAVFLLAAAALLNGVFSSVPMPNDLRKSAVIAHLVTVMAALPLGVSQLVLPKGT
ncbi:MAG: hypothetical protein ABI306_00835, partial [Caulobacteraceae bacterium]